MAEKTEMEELFEQLPWLREKFETEQEIIGEIVKSEHEWERYLAALDLHESFN